MKKLILLCIFFLLMGMLQAQNIPDLNFRTAIANQCPTCIDGSGNLQAPASTLTTLDVSSSNIANLTGIDGFSSLTDLNCSFNVLTSLPSNLPSTITTLICNSNSFTGGLPTLPANLYYLDCNTCQLSSLPALPNSLQYLNCSTNSIANLPTLNSGLLTLECYSNGIVNLPALPGSLLRLVCRNNSISTLPSLPTGLNEIDCAFNNIASLPTLPNSLIHLYCSNNPIPNLPSPLPSSLQTLSCHSALLSGSFASFPLPSTLVIFDVSFNTNITVLPTLPSTLEVLDFRSNKISNLPSLPAGLRTLNCGNNLLTTLGNSLPPSLQNLYCESNLLTGLPTLPNQLTNLFCPNNTGIQSIPPLPLTLEVLSCFDLSSTQFKRLPTLPNSLRVLHCQNNPVLTCLPPLPNSLTSLMTSVNCLPNIPANLTTSLPMCNNATGGPCVTGPAVNGKIFIDNNGNNSYNQGVDSLVHGAVILGTSNGGQLYSCQSYNGNYAIGIGYNQTVTIAPMVNHFTVTPIGGANPISTGSTGGQTFPNRDFSLTRIGNVCDMRVSMTEGLYRPGFGTTIYITYKNVGNVAINGDLVINIDPTLTVLGGAGNSQTITIPSLNYFTQRTIAISVLTPIGTPIGRDIINSVTFNTAGCTDFNLVDNSVSNQTKVVGSYDPNDKNANVSVLSSSEVGAGKEIYYTIRFQNTGNYPADFVIITDTIDNNLDISSIQFLGSSHDSLLTINMFTDIHSPNLPNIIEWHFDNIFLPDSTSNEPASHGFVSFSIKPKNTTLLGTVIKNTGYIVFDYNAAIITNTYEITIANAVAVTGTAAEENSYRIYPNPAKDILHIQANRAGNYQIRLYSLEGRLLHSAENLQGLSTLPVNLINSGHYILQISDEKGSHSQKLIVR